MAGWKLPVDNPMVASKYAVLGPEVVLVVVLAPVAALVVVLAPVAALVAARVNYRRTPRGHITPTTKG